MSYRKKISATVLAVAIAASMSAVPAQAYQGWDRPGSGVTLVQWSKPLILIDHAYETLHFQVDEGADVQYRWQKPYQGVDDDWEFCANIVTLEKLGWTGDSATLQVRCAATEDHTTSEIATQDFAARRESNTYDMPWVLKTKGYLEVVDYTPNYRFALGQADSDWKEAPFKFSVSGTATYTLYTRMPAAYNEYASKTVPVKRLVPMADDGSVTLEDREKAEWEVVGDYGATVVRNLVVSNDNGVLTVELPNGKDILVHLNSSAEYNNSKNAVIEKGRWLKIPKGASAPNADGIPTVYPQGVTMDLYFGTVNDITYTVSFETNGGRTIDPIKVPYQGSLGANFPDFRQPRRSGYKFGGWYMDKNLIDDWDWEFDQVTGDMTLYARWTRDPNYVSDNDDDYTGSNGSGSSGNNQTGGVSASGAILPGQAGYNASGALTGTGSTNFTGTTGGTGSQTTKPSYNNVTSNNTSGNSTIGSSGPKYDLNGSSSKPTTNIPGTPSTTTPPTINQNTGHTSGAQLPTRPVTTPSAPVETPTDTRPTVDTTKNPLYNGGAAGDATAAVKPDGTGTVTVEDEDSPTSKAPKKKSSPLVPVLGVLGAGAAGGAGFYFWKKKQGDDLEYEE